MWTPREGARPSSSWRTNRICGSQRARGIANPGTGADQTQRRTCLGRHVYICTCGDWHREYGGTRGGVVGHVRSRAVWRGAVVQDDTGDKRFGAIHLRALAIVDSVVVTREFCGGTKDQNTSQCSVKSSTANLKQTSYMDTGTIHIWEVNDNLCHLDLNFSDPEKTTPPTNRFWVISKSNRFRVISKFWIFTSIWSL